MSVRCAVLLVRVLPRSGLRRSRFATARGTIEIEIEIEIERVWEEMRELLRFGGGGGAAAAAGSALSNHVALRSNTPAAPAAVVVPLA